LNRKTYYESDDLYYCLHVLPMKHYAKINDALSVLEGTIDRIFRDSEIPSKAMSKQHSIQSCLYQLLVSHGVTLCSFLVEMLVFAYNITNTKLNILNFSIYLQNISYFKERYYRVLLLYYCSRTE
jgi:hypothetical protein